MKTVQQTMRRTMTTATTMEMMELTMTTVELMGITIMELTTCMAMTMTTKVTIGLTLRKMKPSQASVQMVAMMVITVMKLRRKTMLDSNTELTNIDSTSNTVKVVSAPKKKRVHVEEVTR